MTYVTVDLDKPTRLDIVSAWYNVKSIDPDGNVQGRISSSGEGVHIRSRPVAPFPVPINETERRVCGDDPKRVDIDKENTIESNQVLWDTKYGKEAGEWTTDVNHLVKEYQKRQ